MFRSSWAIIREKRGNYLNFILTVYSQAFAVRSTSFNIPKFYILLALYVSFLLISEQKYKVVQI